MTNRINKQELVSRLAEQTNQTLAATERTLDILNDIVISAVRNGEEVFWRGFFTARVKTLAPRLYKTPKGDYTKDTSFKLSFRASSAALERNVL